MKSSAIRMPLATYVRQKLRRLANDTDTKRAKQYDTPITWAFVRAVTK